MSSIKLNTIYASTIVLAILWSAAYYLFFVLQPASANPDYVCIKSVYNQPCRVSSCGSWRTSGTRVCTGVKTTQVAYYLVRTDCERGYYKKALGGNSGGASGRHGGDYVYRSSSCSIVQTDRVAPVGKGYTN